MSGLSFLGSVAHEPSVKNADCVGLYFSAHWCPPCRGFTPQLAEIYNSLKAAGKRFEVVFVSSDQDQASFDEYFAQMPWTALPFSDRDLKSKLSSRFGVRGIPTLILLDSQGSTISDDGRSEVLSDPSGGWIPEPARPSPGSAGAWSQYQDPSTGKPYWHNTETGITTWDNPAASASPPPPPPPPPAAGDWKQYQDPASGRPYWHNPRTNVTTWNDPVASALDQDVAQISRQRKEPSYEKKTVEVGPLWNGDHAQKVGARYLAANPTHKWDGSWWTTVPCTMSVLQIQMPKGDVPNMNFSKSM